MTITKKIFDQAVRSVEERNNVTIEKITDCYIEGKKKSGDKFSFILGFSQDMTNYDTIFYTGEEFSEKEIERFRNLIFFFLKEKERLS